jgi:predicted TPR repeat methyltransferase
MAEHFEQKLVVKLGYCGPEIIARLLAACVTAQANLDVLDGGCGTGLCASLLKPYARRLTGVDISPGMLSKAAEKNCYDDLVEMELHAYLSGQTKAWDLIVMADTLIYFGTLGGLFAAVRQALRPGGLFAFTVEAALENPGSFQLSPSGRYCHHQLYITKLLNEQGFILLRSEDATLRMELGKPVSGFGILAQVS